MLPLLRRVPRALGSAAAVLRVAPAPPPRPLLQPAPRPCVRPFGSLRVRAGLLRSRGPCGCGCGALHTQGEARVGAGGRGPGSGIGVGSLPRRRTTPGRGRAGGVSRLPPAGRRFGQSRFHVLAAGFAPRLRRGLCGAGGRGGGQEVMSVLNWELLASRWSVAVGLPCRSPFSRTGLVLAPRAPSTATGASRGLAGGTQPVPECGSPLTSSSYQEQPRGQISGCSHRPPLPF